VTIQEIKTVWSNAAGLPGYTTMYGVPAGFSLPAVRTFFDALKTLIPAGITIQVPSVGNLINEQTGQITGDWVAAPSTVVTGTFAGAYEAPVGAVVNWMTSSFLAGRRLRGRTYLVPLQGSTTTGQLSGAAQAVIQAAATAFVTAQSGSLLVWGRPKEDPHVDGSIGAVTTALVPDLIAILRSRRD
jgi:hypothetical protein